MSVSSSSELPWFCVSEGRGLRGLKYLLACFVLVLPVFGGIVDGLNPSLGIALTAIAVVIFVGIFVVPWWRSRGARAAVQRMSHEYPGGRVVLVRCTDGSRGALAVHDGGASLWRNGVVELVPWSHVRIDGEPPRDRTIYLRTDADTEVGLTILDQLGVEPATHERTGHLLDSIRSQVQGDSGDVSR